MSNQTAYNKAKRGQQEAYPTVRDMADSYPSQDEIIDSYTPALEKDNLFR